MLKCFLISLVVFVLFSFKSFSSTWYSVSSGAIQTDSMWSLTGSLPGFDAVSLGGFSDTVDLIVQSGHVADLYNTGSVTIRSLEILSGAQFWSTNTANRYLTVYGHIKCDGVIGDGNTYNSISFNIESDSCAITGSGSFDAARIRKNFDSNPITSIHTFMNITLHFDAFSATSFYNNSHGKELNLIIYPGVTFHTIGNGSPSNMSIDGTAGNSIFENSGTITVHGQLIVTGKLYVHTNNSSVGKSCNINVKSGGLLVVDQLICSSSGLGGGSLEIENGGELVLNGVVPFTGFSTLNNIYSLDTGSTVNYNRLNSQSIQDQLTYWNLDISNGGQKTSFGNLRVNNNLLIRDSASLSCLDDTLFVGGDWINSSVIGYEAQTSTLTFCGSMDQQFVNVNDESFYNLIIDNINSNVILTGNCTIQNTLTLEYGIVLSTDSSKIIMDATSFVNGSSDLSFVGGPMIKLGDTDFIFPVGNINKLRTIEIYDLPSYGEVCVQYIYDDPSAYSFNTSFFSPTIHHVSSCEFWRFSSTGPDITGSVRIGWDIQSCGVTDLNSLKVAGWRSDYWEDYDNGGTSGGLLAGSICSTPLLFQQDSISAFTLASSIPGENPLPLVLVDFKGEKLNSDVLLSWKTLSEVNSKEFIIQKSNGNDFFDIGVISAIGYTGSANKYEFIDTETIGSLNYYRLKMVDNDGAIEYSNIVSVIKEVRLRVYPTLVTNTLIIRSELNLKQVEAVLISMAGEVLLVDNNLIHQDNENRFHIELEWLNIGRYALRIPGINKAYHFIKL